MSKLLKTIRKFINESVMTDEQKEWPIVAIMAGQKEVIEVLVALAAENTGFEINWGYVGGRAVILSLGDSEKIREELYVLRPLTNHP
jgi:hypothetical protein